MRRVRSRENGQALPGVEVITRRLLKERLRNNDAVEKVWCELEQLLWSLDTEEKRSIVVATMAQIADDSPRDWLVLWWLTREDHSLADLASRFEVSRSTITREWLPKAVRRFVDRFFMTLGEHLRAAGRELEWRRISLELYVEREGSQRSDGSPQGDVRQRRDQNRPRLRPRVAPI